MVPTLEKVSHKWWSSFSIPHTPKAENVIRSSHRCLLQLPHVFMQWCYMCEMTLNIALDHLTSKQLTHQSHTPFAPLLYQLKNFQTSLFLWHPCQCNFLWILGSSHLNRHINSNDVDPLIPSLLICNWLLKSLISKILIWIKSLSTQPTPRFQTQV